jgi:hypothetical protein
MPSYENLSHYAGKPVADFAALFAGELFPKLKTLALRDCEHADSLAKSVAEAPILSRIETLDLHHRSRGLRG